MIFIVIIKKWKRTPYCLTNSVKFQFFVAICFNSARYQWQRPSQSKRKCDWKDLNIQEKNFPEEVIQKKFLASSASSFACACACVRACVCVWLCVSVCTCVCMSMSMCVCVWCVHVWAFVRACGCVRVWMRLHVDIRVAPGVRDEFVVHAVAVLYSPYLGFVFSAFIFIHRSG